MRHSPGSWHRSLSDASYVPVKPLTGTYDGGSMLGMMFDKSRDAYDQYMGRYSDQLANELLHFVGVRPGVRALDVGCGPGALTSALAERLGAENVAAADPSDSFLAACRDRVPGVNARVAPAEALPWPDESFELLVSQLVLNFLPDADAGLTEMHRVSRPGGIVASCTWDYSDGMRMLRTFWDAALEVDPHAPDESHMRFCTEAELAELWARHGLTQIRTGPLQVTVEYADFDDYWIPFTLGVGAGGAYCATLEPEQLDSVRSACLRRLGSPEGAFGLTARAFAVTGQRPG
jgi:ubiquinone/menaquinone biosynthesis C-methylase UbiE